MSYPKSCEYKGWMRKGGGNCFRSQYRINSPRERCNGPAGCVWRSQRSRSPIKSPSRGGSRSPPRCVWGKRSIYDDRVGTCYNRDAVRFDKTGWKKCNYPSNCKGKTNYGNKIYGKSESDDEDDSNESDDEDDSNESDNKNKSKMSKSPRKMTCKEMYENNFLLLNEEELKLFYSSILKFSDAGADESVMSITRTQENIKTFTNLYKKLKALEIFELCKSNAFDEVYNNNILEFISIALQVFYTVVKESLGDSNIYQWYDKEINLISKKMEDNS